MSLKDQMSLNAGLFLNPEEFGQLMFYINSENDAKQIKALIVQEILAPGDNNRDRSLENSVEVFIAQKDVQNLNIVKDRLVFTECLA